MVASIFLITMLAFDRYYSISRFRSFPNKRYWIYAFITWLCSAVIAAPQFINSKYESSHAGNGTCRVLWDEESDELTPEPTNPPPSMSDDTLSRCSTARYLPAEKNYLIIIAGLQKIHVSHWNQGRAICPGCHIECMKMRSIDWLKIISRQKVFLCLPRGVIKL